MIKKIIITLIILITLTNVVIPVVNAVQEITKANLINDHKINTHILYYNEGKSQWRNVQCGYICYKANEEKYPAYCIVPNTNGVDEEGAYTVTINNLLQDNLIYNVLINGYPYKTPTQLGVETIDDAYVATKLALKNVLLGRDIKSFYKSVDTKGEKIIDAMCDIANKGIEGKATNKEAVIYIDKIGGFIEAGNYYYQEYKVTANVNISNYIVNSIERFPEGTYISDTNGTKKENFSTGEKFRIMIPKTKLVENIKGKINVTALCNTNSIFYGKAPNSNIQDYAITYKPYVEYEECTTLDLNTNKASIKIIKKDEETSKPIENVMFGLYNIQDEYLTSQTTNEEGIATFFNLYQGKYRVKEITANMDYIKDENVYEINTEYNKEISRVITNTHKKGSLKIIKVDSDDNNELLDGIEFDLLDSNEQLVAHLITDEKGEAYIENINTGKYTIKETKTKENYNLCIDNNIEVVWNDIAEIEIKNEKKKGKIKIIKQDAEKKEIKLQGVEFQILDCNNQIVEELITDINGEAVTTRLPIGEYIIRETNIGSNNEYVLDEKEYKIIIEEDKTSLLLVENKHKKGNLKITKVDKDDKTITLGAIEFDLINEAGEIVTHLITDINGEAYIENINTGKYTLKETKTKREYKLCENADIIVKWNEISDIVIENEKQKGQIKIIKRDSKEEGIKLKGVKFQIIDINNKVVEEIETDEQGTAISSKLLIGEYEVKEIDLGNNTNYLLNNKTFTVQVENETTSEFIVENEHKKGNLVIKKVDKDDNGIVLEGVEFKIIDKDGFEYYAITDKNGIAKVDNIRIGNVKIKEMKSNQEYILNSSIFEVEIKENEYVEILIENEKKKGQVEVYKIDKENNNIKIPNVEFEILNSNNEVVDKIITNEEGHAISKLLIKGEYYLKETKSNTNYILKDDIIKFTINEEITTLKITNEKKKGKIKIIKTSSMDSPVFNIKYGDTLKDIAFEIYNSKNELVDTLITDEQGYAISQDLEVGRYKVVEKNTDKYYLLNKNEYFINIEENDEIKYLKVENEPIIPRVEIEKTGQQFAEKNEEIKYEFNIMNSSNSKLENFTWIEYIPYDKCKLTKMVTGVYNEELEYEIYYKTNKNDYKLLKKLNTLASEYINFDEIELENEETITQIKVEYGIVSENFNSIIKPYIYAKVNENVKKDEKILNITELSGKVNDYIVKDKSNFETIIEEKEIIKKLPKTGC